MSRLAAKEQHKFQRTITALPDTRANHRPCRAAKGETLQRRGNKQIAHRRIVLLWPPRVASLLLHYIFLSIENFSSVFNILNVQFYTIYNIDKFSYWNFYSFRSVIPREYVSERVSLTPSTFRVLLEYLKNYGLYRQQCRRLFCSKVMKIYRKISKLWKNNH